MRRFPLAAAILLVAAMLLTPSTASAQISIGLPYYAGHPSPWGYSYYPYGSGGLAWPGAYSYTQRYYWYGYNWPYPGYFLGHYYVPPTVPRDGTSTPEKSSNSSDRSSSYSYGATVGTTKAARVVVLVPQADATVWVEGKATQLKGTRRQFNSPPLDPSQRYEYQVRARWTENGKAVEKARTVRIRADDAVTVDFTASK